MQIKPLMMSSVVQVQWYDTKLRISLLIMKQRYCCTLRNMPDGTHFDVAMAMCSVPVPSSIKSNIAICSCMGQKLQLKMLKRRPKEGGNGMRLR